MRKALIAVAVATALFAVGAFAASFALNAEDVASGEDPVSACAEQVDVDFDTDEAIDANTGHWMVTTVNVTFLLDTDAATEGCDAYDAELALNLGTEAVNAYEVVDTTVVDGSTATFTLSPTVDVETIWGASVLVGGMELSGDLP